MLITKLSIPEPCPESWENMHTTQKGKFCDLCSKEVIDFTKWTDVEIIKYFENTQTSTGKTCGKLSAQQLDRINQILQNHSKEPNLWRIFAWAFSASALSSIVAIQNINAAEKPINQELIESFANKNEADSNAEVNEKDSLKQSWVISGTVKNISNSTPFVSAIVSIRGTDLATVTDFNGNYTLDLSKLSSRETVILEATASGFEFYEQEITKKDAVCNINLFEEANELKEVVVVGYSCENKSSVVGRVMLLTSLGTGKHITNKKFTQRTWNRTKNFFKRIF